MDSTQSRKQDLMHNGDMSLEGHLPYDWEYAHTEWKLGTENVFQEISHELNLSLMASIVELGFVFGFFFAFSQKVAFVYSVLKLKTTDD